MTQCKLFGFTYIFRSAKEKYLWWLFSNTLSNLRIQLVNSEKKNGLREMSKDIRCILFNKSVE